MPIFGRKRDAGSQSRVHPTIRQIDPRLPDAEWLNASRASYELCVGPFYGSPDTIAEGGKQCLGQKEFGIALFFFQKSIDLLHTNYGFGGMASRKPSQADEWILAGYVSALRNTLEHHPAAQIRESVRETTHRLRSISTECQNVGLPNDLYLNALGEIASCATHVDFDDIRWT